MDHHYLVVDDDENTQLLIERAFRNLDLAVPLQFVKDGDEAIAYLTGEGKYQDRKQHPMPALVLLDLKMPRKDGLEVLRWIRASPYKSLVVVMFTGSDEQRDVIEAYEAGVNSFVHKPVSYQELQQTLSSIHHYWFACNFFPNLGNGIGGRKKSVFKLVREP